MVARRLIGLRQVRTLLRMIAGLGRDVSGGRRLHIGEKGSRTDIPRQRRPHTFPWCFQSYGAVVPHTCRCARSSPLRSRAHAQSARENPPWRSAAIASRHARPRRAEPSRTTSTRKPSGPAPAASAQRVHARGGGAIVARPGSSFPFDEPALEPSDGKPARPDGGTRNPKAACNKKNPSRSTIVYVTTRPDRRR